MHLAASSPLHLLPSAPLHRHLPSSATNHLSNLNRLLPTSASPAAIANPRPPPISSPSPWTTFFEPKMTDHEQENISPRSLQSLRRLLADTPEDSSPRHSIAHRWRTLHGSSHWFSLLDPLDPDLRCELLRYGEHVQSTYLAFHAENQPDPAHPDVPVPDPSYRLTRHLQATSSVSLPSWVDVKVPKWLSQRTSWIGYVAVCDDREEIRRLGRRDIVIALRGTATCLEWAENFRSRLVDIPASPSDDPSIAPKVQQGLRSLLNTPAPHARSLSETVVDEVRRLVNTYRGEQLSITLTGHSLGASLALLLADELAGSVPEAPPATVFTFGGPRVGNRGFAKRLTKRGVRVLRVVNERDMVTRVPGVFVSEAVDTWLNGEGGALDGAAATWGYWHVGSELRVDSRASPYLREDAGPSCCHDLEAYLHLVDGFLASRRPFRENATRSIARLMSLQGGSVKKLYTNEAAAMGLRLD